MPMYSYRCPRCKAETQDMRCIADHADGPRCYRCGKAQMEQILDGAPLALVRNPAVAPGRPWRKS